MSEVILTPRKKPRGGGGARNPRSLANLRRGNVETLQPGAGAWEPGATTHLEHGLRSRRPTRIVLDPIVRELEDALAADLPLKDADGNVPAPDRFAVELAAVALLRVRRCHHFLELHGVEDERGELRAAFVEFGRAVEHAFRALDRLGCSPRARAALGVDLSRMAQFDLALAMSEAGDDPPGGGPTYSDEGRGPQRLEAAERVSPRLTQRAKRAEMGVATELARGQNP
jgi:hypothetical protein